MDRLWEPCNLHTLFNLSIRDPELWMDVADFALDSQAGSSTGSVLVDGFRWPIHEIKFLGSLSTL